MKFLFVLVQLGAAVVHE